MPAKATSGEPLRISAKDWNALLDVLTKALSDRLSIAADPVDRSLPPGCVWLENTTTEDRDAGDVMGLDGPIWSAKDSEEEYKKARGMRGVAVDRDKHLGKFVILMDAIPAGQFGRARIAGGPIAVKLEVKNESHTLADVVTSTPGNLKTGRMGAAHILWVEPKEDAEDSGSPGGPVSSVRRAVVTLGPFTFQKMFAKTNGDGIPAATVDEGGYWVPGVAGATLWDNADPDDEEAGDDDLVATDETVNVYHYGPDTIPGNSRLQLSLRDTAHGPRLVPDVQYCTMFPADEESPA